MDLISQHAEWLTARSYMLARMFAQEQEDCYQDLALALLQHGSQKTAWLKVTRDMGRRAAKDVRLHPLDFDPIDSQDAPLCDLELEQLLEEALTEEELTAWLSGHTQEWIARMTGSCQARVSRLLDSTKEKLRGALV